MKTIQKPVRASLLAMAACLIASPVMADFMFTEAGPLNSAGAVGDPGNSTFSASSSGGIYSSQVFSGDLTEVNTGTFASEARFNVTDGNGYNANFQPSTTSSFSGTLSVNETRGGAFWAPTGTAQVETFESFDDGAGVDATWSDVSFSLTNEIAAIELGNFASGTDFLFDTEGSLFDTELGGFFGDGVFLDSNDDGGTGLLSSLDLGLLADGDYFAVLGGFNTIFSDYIALAGSSAGDFVLNMNGAEVAAGTLGTNEVMLLHFSVGSILPPPPMGTPEPGILVLLGLGLAGLGFARRRG